LVLPFSRLIINSVSCTASYTQMAAVEALTGPQDSVEAMVREFQVRRDLIVDGLNGIEGIRCLEPHGAFYVFPNIAGTGMDGARFADRMLYEGGVSVLAGTAFGSSGVDHVRISYANSQDNIREALRRIAGVVAGVGVGAV
jgi:aspartate aminotransferase